MVGRIGKYNKKLLAKCQEYIDKWVEDKHGGTEVIPTLVGLQLYIGISETLYYDWMKHERKKPFLEFTRRVMQMQKKELSNKGITGEFNPNITKLLLTKHGFVDKKEQKLTDGDGNALVPAVIKVEYVDPKPIDE